MEIEAEGEKEKIALERAEEDYVPFVLWRLKGVKGVCLVEYEGKRRYLPRIIVEAMKHARRPITEIKCAESVEALKRMGY